MSLKPITTKVALPTVYDVPCSICGHKVHTHLEPVKGYKYWCRDCSQDHYLDADWKMERAFCRR
jgi:hypothetical protein